MSRLTSQGLDPDDAVRHVRNDLDLVAVALIDPTARVVAATSSNLVGDPVANDLLLFGMETGSMAAVAAPLGKPVLVDGVVERSAGDIAYQVLQPLVDGEALLVYYDINELLERRARAQGIQGETLQLLGIAGLFVVLASVLLIGRSFVKRDLREIAFEAEVMQQQAAELEVHNRQLSAARAEAERALALAEEKNRIRAEFVLMINHELRTPLTSVVTGAELLADAPDLDQAERRELLGQMLSDGRRLQDMIGQMLAVARIENRGLHFTVKEVSLSSLLADLAVKHSRLEIDALTEDEVTLMMSTDPTTLSQLLSSLIDNSITHGATRVRLLHLPALPFDPVWEVGRMPQQPTFLLVADNGPGIELEFVSRAFEKFEKHSRSSGTGLGLYMARMMVEALGGSLSVATSSQGTIMAVAVPLSESRTPIGARA